MCRVASATYPRTPAAPADSRHKVAEWLQRWELPDLVDTATLLVSELTTNALLHAYGDIELSAAVADGVVEVGIGDHDSRPPRVRDRQPVDPDHDMTWLATTGRGLFLVDQLADEWGVDQRTDGKQVWFRLAASHEWPYRASCGCTTAELRRLRLGSGAWALHNEE